MNDNFEESVIGLFFIPGISQIKIREKKSEEKKSVSGIS